MSASVNLAGKSRWWGVFFRHSDGNKRGAITAPQSYFVQLRPTLSSFVRGCQIGRRLATSAHLVPHLRHFATLAAPVGHPQTRAVTGFAGYLPYLPYHKAYSLPYGTHTHTYISLSLLINRYGRYGNSSLAQSYQGFAGCHTCAIPLPNYPSVALHLGPERPPLALDHLP